MSVLPFSVSLFTLTDDLGGSVNHLGVQSYVSYWSGRILPQITILTNYPRYHAILCSFLKFLEDANEKPNPVNVRILECLFGLLVTSREGPHSPINVTKYLSLINKLDGESVSKRDVQDDKYKVSLMTRLGYGVLGFYVNPSIRWGLIHPETRKLKPVGRELAVAFETTCPWPSLLKKWWTGESVNIQEKKFDTIAISADPDLAKKDMSAKESAIWQKVLSEFLKGRQEGVFWSQGIPSTIQESMDNEQTYPSFFANLSTLFGDNTFLRDQFQATAFFEKAFALIEFVFEYEFLKLIDKTGSVETDAIERQIPEILRAAIYDFQKIRDDKRADYPLFDRLKMITTYSDIKHVIIKHHMLVQERKGKTPWMNHTQILQFGYLDGSKAKQTLELAQKFDLESAARFIYRKDWNIRRALKYREYMV